ncbi:coiled-coil domain-containing protein 171-like isoform X2 [Mugil cephalus]|uniref:coiled-coil domain-containing protein 171-like isoform X2 n=1 Tax=Mugil cephalus TaxID=48193 RepID=UPI001FB72001|nr:coiled-coil domain-containing protein 171-like isoform X2 [Mugil cephalus]
MQTEAAERRRNPGRLRRGESGQSRAQPPGRDPRTTVEEMARLPEQQEERGDGGRGREREERGGGRRAASEGGEGSEEPRRLRWRLNQLEKEKLQLTSSHNQELCRLQAELARLRASVERGEAERADLQHRITVTSRDSERTSAELSRDKRSLTERAAELQQKVEELQRALDLVREAREEDQHALQQEVEERDKLIQSFSSENQRLHRLLQDQEEALEEAERRLLEAQKEREMEAEANRRRAEELKYLVEREEAIRTEKEASDQRAKALQANLEAERAAHLESKFNSEIVQLRVRDLEAGLQAERCSHQEALCSLERAIGLERERSSTTERALERLKTEHEQHKSEMSVVLETERKTTSDLTERLEDEKRRCSLLEEEAQRRSEVDEAFMKQIREALQQHGSPDTRPAKDDGKQSPPADVLQLLTSTLSSYNLRLKDSDKQLQDLLFASEKLQDEVLSLRGLTSDQRSQIDEHQRALIQLEAEVCRWRQESSDWSIQRRSLQDELQREREERKAEVQKITEQHNEETTVRLSFLHRLYQRLLAGCVLLSQPQSILGNFTWEELCDVIDEQVDQLTSDLQKAKDKIARLQSVCSQRSVCVRQLQRNQQSVLSRLEEAMRRREEAWSHQHQLSLTQLQGELQTCRSQSDSLRHRCSSLTSDLSRLRGESSSLLAACSLLAGALSHAHIRLRSLAQQKTLVCRRLQERELLEEEVRRLVGALGVGGPEEEEKEEMKRRSRRRRWRRSVCAVMAVRRWSLMSRNTTVLLRLERGGGATSVCMRGGGGGGGDEDEDESREGVCSRWLRSERLSSVILSSTSDLQEALSHTGSSPPSVISAARSALSRLLDHILDQSDPSPSSSLIGWLRLGLPPPKPNVKTLVSDLQRHFLLFSQRLHSVEVERRGLRLEVANLKRGLHQGKEDTSRTVPEERFQTVCLELRRALTREEEAQTLIREQFNQLQKLQLRVDAHNNNNINTDEDTQRTLGHATQALSEARLEASRKERSLRILAKHLAGVQREKRRLEEKLQRAEDKLRDATRRQEAVVGFMKAAETSYEQVRNGLVQSQRSPLAKPHPLLSAQEHLSGAESIMGAPEVAACQSFLSVVSRLVHTITSVSAHRSDSQVFIPVVEFPETFPLAEPQPVPLSDSSKGHVVCISPAHAQISPSPLMQPNPVLAKSKERKPTKKKKRVNVKR